ncbi:MAG TPA: two-component regulator propeller domain-containing protein [Phnomibacter sp.]|nr:two-component regulator propeller domain-containing protein [Phnomibacter sp.]
MKFFIAIVFILFASASSWAQPDASIVHYTTEDGLSDNRITCFAKDEEGFLWIGTWSGLNRFDGKTFVSYGGSLFNGHSLRNRIDRIVADKKNNLWIQFRDGEVCRFNKKTEQLFEVEPNLKDEIPGKANITYVLPDEESVWLMTEHHGIFSARPTANSQYKYQQYSNASPKSIRLPSNTLLFFFADKAGNKWISTDSGLVMLSEDTHGRITKKQLPTLPDIGNINHIIEEGNMVWFSCTKGWLLGYNKTTQKFSSYKIDNQPMQDLFASQGNQWVYLIGKAGKLYRFQPGTGQTTPFQMAGSPAFHSLFGDSSGNIFIEPEDNGVIRFDPKKSSFDKYVLKSNPEFFKSFRGFERFLDNKGRFWAIMKGSGLGYYDSARQSISYFYNNPDDPLSKFYNSVRVIYYDPQGVMWLATQDVGMLRIVFRDNNIVKNGFSPRLSVPLCEVRGVSGDFRNRLWVANKAGELTVIENNKPVKIQFNQSEHTIENVYCLFEDSRRNMWIGTKGYGLFQAIPQNLEGTVYDIKYYGHQPGNPHSLGSDKIYSVAEDKAGRIWVATFEAGLNMMQNEGGQTSFLHPKNGLTGYPSNGFLKMRHITVDNQGRLWAGTTDGLMVVSVSLNQKAGFSFKTYKNDANQLNSLSENDVQFIYQDSHQNIWICTGGGGINKVIETAANQPLQFQRISIGNGPQYNYVISCVEDFQSNLWFTTPTSLIRYDGKRFRFYNSNDGIPAKGFSEAASTRIANGDLAFGTYDGYITFSPQALQDHAIKANLVFTNLLVNNGRIEVGDSSGILSQSLNEIKAIELGYKQSIFSIDFEMLDYRYYSNGLFAYRLRGFDDEWKQSQQDINRITYTNLPPGKYVLEVKSLSTDRYSNDPIRRLSIHILPPPWKTWWAYLIYALIATAIGVVVYRTTRTLVVLRNKVSIEKKMAELKLRFFNHISHELRTPLSLIQGPADELAQKHTSDPAEKSNIHIIQKNASRMSRFINQLLDLGKMQHGKMVLHISEMEMAILMRQTTGYFMNALKEKQMRIEVQADPDPLHAWIDADKIETVLYNLLANAMKFGPKGSTIFLGIHKGQAPDTIKITVRDQGPGVQETELDQIFALYYEGAHHPKQTLKGTGIGLALSKEIIDLHHGSIYATNNEDGGLTVTIILPTSKTHFSADKAIITEPSTATAIWPIEKDEAPVITPTHSQTLPEQIIDELTEKPHVLLVEDNDDMRDFLTRQLQTIYQVHTAANGLLGLQKAQQIVPNLIVSDVMMPEMDGLTMLDLLKKNPATSHIPVVLLTAKYDVESQVEGLKYGADYYIPKPFNIEFVKAAISNLLKQREQLFAQLQAPKKEAEPIQQSLITTHDEQFLRDVIASVEAGLPEPDFDIDSIATSVAMSRSAFYKKFKSLTNKAPVEFLNEMRMKKAKQLFEEGEHRISYVSMAVGFNSTKYFSTSFRKYYQLSPSEFLKQLV